MALRAPRAKTTKVAESNPIPFLTSVVRAQTEKDFHVPS